MRKKLLTLFVSLFCTVTFVKADFVKFSDGLAETKPLAVMIYASWADDLDEVSDIFSEKQAIYGDRYNFSELDIASEDAKEFNKSFQIYPNLPYIILFKEKGKITRYIPKSCIEDSSCIDQRFKFFVN